MLSFCAFLSLRPSAYHIPAPPECTRNREYNYSYAQTQLNAGMGLAVGAGALLAVPWGGGPHAIDDRRTDLPRHAAGFGERWGRERDRQTDKTFRERERRD